MKDIIRFTVFSLAFMLLANCARVGSPTGGPKDSIAPIMAIAKPANKSTLFNSKKITIGFDEYIRLEKLNTQLIISPPMDKKPIIRPQSSVAKKITISFLESLKPNTTYTINFGNSIVDNNEGNKLGKFSYVFATGAKLDSLSISGKVIDPKAGKEIESISIMAYKNAPDSLIGNYTPDYVTNTLNSNEYVLENLSSSVYDVIALEDKNNNYKYDKGAERIGFLSQKINLTKPLDSVYFTLFKEPKNNKVFRPIQSNQNLIIIGYQGKNTPNIEVDGLNKKKYFISKPPNKDSLYLWIKQLPSDSIYLKIKQDTLTQQFTVKPRELSKDSLRIYKNIQDILNPNDSLILNSNIPIKTIYKDSLQLLEQDSIPIPFNITNNPTKQQLIVLFKRKVNKNYSLILKQASFKDVLNNISKKQKLKFRTLDNEEYGEIIANIKSKQAQRLIVKLLNSKLKTKRVQIINKPKQVYFKNLPPDKYRIRIVKDLNQNNLADEGSFKKKIQPEPIYNFEKVMILRANSEINENIVLY